MCKEHYLIYVSTKTYLKEASVFSAFAYWGFGIDRSIGAILALLAFLFPHVAIGGTLADRLAEYHFRDCSDQKLGDDLRYEVHAPRPAILGAVDGNYYTIDVVGDQGYAEVLVLEGDCEFPSAYCGSGGCWGYIIFENRAVFEFQGGRPFSVPTRSTELDGNIIVFPKAPSNCQIVGAYADMQANDTECLAVGYWNGISFSAMEFVRPISIPRE